jgi:hypothetical protein
VQPSRSESRHFRQCDEWGAGGANRPIAQLDPGAAPDVGRWLTSHSGTVEIGWPSSHMVAMQILPMPAFLAIRPHCGDCHATLR